MRDQLLPGGDLLEQVELVAVAERVVVPELLCEARRVPARARVRRLHECEVAVDEDRVEHLLQLGLEGVERAVDPLTQLAVALRVHRGRLRREQPVERRAGGGRGRVVLRLVDSELLLQLVRGMHIPTRVQVLKNECVQ